MGQLKNMRAFWKRIAGIIVGFVIITLGVSWLLFHPKDPEIQKAFTAFKNRASLDMAKTIASTRIGGNTNIVNGVVATPTLAGVTAPVGCISLIGGSYSNITISANGSVYSDHNSQTLMPGGGHGVGQYPLIPARWVTDGSRTNIYVVTQDDVDQKRVLILDQGAIIKIPNNLHCRFDPEGDIWVAIKLPSVDPSENTWVTQESMRTAYQNPDCNLKKCMVGFALDPTAPSGKIHLGPPR